MAGESDPIVYTTCHPNATSVTQVAAMTNIDRSQPPRCSHLGKIAISESTLTCPPYRTMTPAPRNTDQMKTNRLSSSDQVTGLLNTYRATT